MLYTKDHEWIKIEKNIGIVGISDYAAEHLGDVTFVELPTIGKIVKKGDVFASVESVKAVSDIYAPVSGKIIEVNIALENQPELINESSENAAWMIKLEISSPDEANSLMDSLNYKTYLEGAQ
ncbi:MAG: glycine cleavage system protein GcvH [Candidatus Margulisiibacteriota bacterium]|jgi:glycine cleavage system H protein